MRLGRRGLLQSQLNPPRLGGRLALHVIEVARVLGLGVTKTRELVTAGEIRSVRVGRRILIPVSALEQFLEEQQHHLEEEPQGHLLYRLQYLHQFLV